MYASKERFTNKVPQFLPDSPKSSSTPHQANWYSKNSKSLLSFWSNIFPSFRRRSKTSNHQSVSLRSNYDNFNQQNDPMDESDNLSPMRNNINSKDMLKGKSNGEDQAPGKNCNSCDVFEEVKMKHSPNTPKKPVSKFTDDSTFISPELDHFLESCLPNIVKGCKRVLLYSTLKHGISLRTLLRNSAKISGPGLLIVGDMKGAVFGALLDCPLKPTAKRKYQGTNQTFVFTTIYGQPRLFLPTGANRYYYLCMNDLLAIGGGGSSAICLDEDLLTGTSGPCDTFGSLCLAHSSEFELKNVELWGFTHASTCLGQG